MEHEMCPVGIRLTGRRVVFAGAGEVAQRKIQRVLKMGASITVIAPEAAAEIEQLAASGTISLSPRTAEPSDFAGAFLAFIATSDGDANRALAQAARSHGALVNQADDPDNCDFVLPALAYMNTLRIGVFSESPALSKWVRRYLERTLGDKFPEFAGVFGRIRQKIRMLELPQQVRAEIVSRLLNEGLYETYRDSGEKATIAHAETVVREYVPKGKN
ncbi:MAG: precorrin-2 dehydrogenase/sirohydrochlorin ferrochelatase family protein [Candidatus Sumerlaeaceae bacterium]